MLGMQEEYMKRIRSTGFVLTLILLLEAACSSTVPPTATKRAPIPLDRNAGVYVVAQQQREAIIDSLWNAGIEIATDLGSMGYGLDVRLGSSRGNRPCGSVHNVVYTLSNAGRRLLVIKGRGATGTCDPNIFDEMSRELFLNLN